MANRGKTAPVILMIVGLTLCVGPALGLLGTLEGVPYIVNRAAASPLALFFNVGSIMWMTFVGWIAELLGLATIAGAVVWLTGRRKKWIVVAGLVFPILLGFGLFLLLVPWLLLTAVAPLSLQPGPGTFDKPRFVAIVQQVRALGVKPCQQLELRLDDVSNPKSLRRLKPKEAFGPGWGEGNVWVEMTAGGKLKVVIETKDLGHCGEYGFGYSESPLSLQPLGENGEWYLLDLPGPVNIVSPDMKIDDNWWEVLNNLN